MRFWVIGVHLRLSVAQKIFSKPNKPPINVEEPDKTSLRGFPLERDVCFVPMSGGEIDSLTERVLGAVFEVSNTLGAGFLEKVYERALLAELGMRGIRAVAQASFSVGYKGRYVGEYFTDLLVEGVLVIELKCAERLANEHMTHCINYLRASGRTVCLLVNFQRPKVEWKRVVYGVAEEFCTT
jgi:GxxExxY protein